MSTDPMFGCWIDVDPKRLWWQCGDHGPKRITEAPHYEAACQIVAGEEPTAYRIKKRSPGHVQGNMPAIKGLVRSLRKGWNPKAPRPTAWINRRGEIVLTDGMHRSAIAAAVGLPRIPVAIVARDEDWWRVKHALKKLNGGVKLYQPVDHPDLAWPAWRKDTGNRAEVIGDYLREHQAQQVADIGCHSGALSLALARQGFTVTGYDHNELAIKAAQALAPMTDIGGEGRARFEVSGLVPQLPELDAVVMLSALNHCWAKGHWQVAEDIVTAIFQAAPRLVFDCPTSGDPVAGDGDFTDPNHVLSWMAEAAGKGKGRILAPRGEMLQRTLLVWERDQ